MTRALTSNGGSRLAMEAAARDAFHAMAGTDQYKLSGQEILGALDAGLLASFEQRADPPRAPPERAPPRRRRYLYTR